MAESVDCPLCDESYDPQAEGYQCPECDSPAPVSDDGDESNDDATPDEDQVECPDCGNTVPDRPHCTDCGFELTEDPPTVFLEVGDTEYEVAVDGSIVLEDDSFGKNARYDAIHQGVPKAKAKTVSRAHLQFDVADGDVIVEANGRNKTIFNGDVLDDGERRPVSEGDEIGLNDVVTATVRTD